MAGSRNHKSSPVSRASGMLNLVGNVLHILEPCVFLALLGLM